MDGSSCITFIEISELIMEKNKWYLVTKDSNDTTLIAGDHIYLDDDGTLICREAGGWIEKEHVAESLDGAEIEVDQDEIKRSKATLMAALARMVLHK
jgi:hypothetical protein